MEPSLLALIGVGLVAGLGIAMPPGAVAVLILEQSMRAPRLGVAAACGVATVDTLACAVAFGAGALVSGLLSGLGAWPAVIAGGVLIVIGAIGLFRHVRSAGERRTAPTRSFGATMALFIGITVVNPATLVYFLAIALGVQNRVNDPFSLLVVVLSAGLASLAWQLVLVVIGSVMGRTLSLRAQRTVNVIGSLVVVAIGVTVIALALTDARS